MNTFERQYERYKQNQIILFDQERERAVVSIRVKPPLPSKSFFIETGIMLFFGSILFFIVNSLR